MLATTPFGPIGREVYERTYQRREDADWLGTVKRVVAGNTSLVMEKYIEPGEREALEALMADFKILPAGRHLWASGATTTLGLFNCHRAGWTYRLHDHFTFVFDQLMLGGGVGANYSQEYLNMATLDPGATVNMALSIDKDHPDYDACSSWLNPRPNAIPHVVKDSREGWVEALGLLFEAYQTNVHWLAFDFSRVRPHGSPIKGFGGTASGPAPLMEMLTRVCFVLNHLDGNVLDPLSAMEIDHQIAACVVAGNVRRSARMSILHWKDKAIHRFIDCKADHSHHWSTNISVEVDDEFFQQVEAGDAHALSVLHSVVRGMYTNGEPGFYNSSKASEGEHADVRSTNPCGEIALQSWEQCCLGHVNLSAFHDDPEGARAAFRLMARYLVRATFGKASDVRQEMVKSQNRRIGVGFFGFHDWAALRGVRFDQIPEDQTTKELLVSFKQAVDLAAIEYAQELLIPVPIKTTTVAPTGSIAKLPGVSEGIQPPYARYFVRRVRYAASDPKLADLAHLHQEPCLYSKDTTVVSFVAHDPITERVADDMILQSDEVSLEAYLAVQETVQSLYADNAVSITANFRREDISEEDFKRNMIKWLPSLKGFTAMPEDGRPQSPYERLSVDEYRQANEVSAFQAMDDCSSGGACPIR